ncbi:cyclic nucleotide-binding domain-containing protein 2-like [Saccoglossus kowalevskii]
MRLVDCRGIQRPHCIMYTFYTPKERFLKAARQVRMLCAVTISIRQYATEAGVSLFSTLPDLAQSMSKLPNVKTDTENGGTQIAFDPRAFKSNYEFTIPTKVEKILEKNPEERTVEDVNSIANLMRGLHSFRKYTKAIQLLLCKVVRLERYGRRRVVVRKGHRGRGFYFIFSGTACVTLDEDDESVFVKKEVSVLKKGASFGEIALMKDIPRTATIVCMEDTEFLVIDKDDFFANDLHLHIQKEFEFRHTFLSKLDIFATWSESSLQEISDMGRLEEYNHDSLIVKDARQYEWLLFVTKGRCDVLKLVDLSKIPSFQQALEQEYGEADSLNGRKLPALQSLLEDYIAVPKGHYPPQTGTNLGVPVQNTNIQKNSPRPRTTGRMLPKHGEGDEGRSRSKSAAMKLTYGTSSKNKIDLERKESGSNPYLVLSNDFNSSDDGSIHENSFFSTKSILSQGTPTNANQIGYGVFVKVDSVRAGQCFGLQGIIGKMPHISLVSGGCEVIRVSMSRFREDADAATLREVEKQIPVFPSDAELCAKFLKQSKWKNFKSDIVQGIIADAQFKKQQTDVRGQRSGRKLSDNMISNTALFTSHAMPKIQFSAEAWVSNAVPKHRDNAALHRPRPRTHARRLQISHKPCHRFISPYNSDITTSRPDSSISQCSSQVAPQHSFVAQGSQRRLVVIERVSKPTYTGSCSWRNYYQH